MHTLIIHRQTPLTCLGQAAGAEQDRGGEVPQQAEEGGGASVQRERAGGRAEHQVQGGVPAARGGVQVGGQSAVVISATCYVRVHCILNILQHVPYSYKLGS